MCLKIPFISNNIHFALGLVIFYFGSLRTIVIVSEEKTHINSTKSKQRGIAPFLIGT